MKVSAYEEYHSHVVMRLGRKDFFLRFYLFIHERHRERGRDTGREREAGSMQGSPMWDSILGLQDHTLGRRWH